MRELISLRVHSLNIHSKVTTSEKRHLLLKPILSAQQQFYLILNVGCENRWKLDARSKKKEEHPTGVMQYHFEGHSEISFNRMNNHEQKLTISFSVMSKKLFKQDICVAEGKIVLDDLSTSDAHPSITDYDIPLEITTREVISHKKSWTSMTLHFTLQRKQHEALYSQVDEKGEEKMKKNNQLSTDGVVLMPSPAIPFTVLKYIHLKYTNMITRERITVWIYPTLDFSFEASQLIFANERIKFYQEQFWLEELVRHENLTQIFNNELCSMRRKPKFVKVVKHEWMISPPNQQEPKRQESTCNDNDDELLQLPDTTMVVWFMSLKFSHRLMREGLMAIEIVLDNTNFEGNLEKKNEIMLKHAIQLLTAMEI
ncbi:hypothetical protein C9374_007692 [Naegleria lovaniensis]|uniref:Uncharacterized protein n=1 Tax=Naegleria lovaniensis TaxID=51637 RepID=A0AA88GK85_NAELO|nr:uncharacterized protein C9374_007692 [Naegleria lovaniensis]KAG2379054.1 hypothetical protein C9374_007692 [Naegleria lovaniensis]